MNPRDQRRRAGGRSGRLGLLMTGVLLVGCSSAAGTLTPVPTATSSPPKFSPTEATTSTPLRQPGATPTATPTPAGTQPPIATATPTPDASPSSPAPAGSDPTSIPAALPVRGLTIGLDSEILMAPRPQGGLYVSIPSPDGPPYGTVVALLDPRGQVAKGWPIQLVDAPICSPPLVATDGSVRIVCETGGESGRALAFDATGRMLPGWPVVIEGWGSWGGGQRVIGDRMVVVGRGSYESVDSVMGRANEAWLVTVDADATVRTGARLRADGPWSIGPDATAYGVSHPSPWAEGPSPPQVSVITAFDLAGPRPGWPARVDGVASAPAFGPEGHLYLTVGSYTKAASRTVVLDRDGQIVPGGSRELPIATAGYIEMEGHWTPGPPLVGADGTAFVSGAPANAPENTVVVGLDSSGRVMPGWPQTPCWYPVGGAWLDAIASALGPGKVVYSLCAAPDAESSVEPTTGGSIVATGPDGRVRPGWPLVLSSPRAEIRSAVVGSDGTVYAVAIEPESDHLSSATIIAIAPDGTIRSRTTVATRVNYYSIPPLT
jgi:hypothetical protein